MSPEFTVRASSHTYPVIIEPGCRHKLYEKINHSYSQYFIITDTNVSPLYLEEVKRSFKKTAVVYTIPAGEGSKSLEQFEKICSFALDHGIDRNSVIIALGGGVVGDIAGFSAASYMRGIDFIQVPTTLLAHDSSVGGKTGINLPGGKNMIGAFHAPKAVMFDPEVFHTLPEREWRSGLAEVIKHGLIYDYSLYSWVCENVSARQVPDTSKLVYLLERSVKVKRAIVESDEKEKGIRAFLNFGHTLGHAIEAEAGYGLWTHGEAVAMGMAFALKVSEEVFQTSLDSGKIINQLEQLGYHTSLPENMNTDRLIDRMKRDKKGINGQIRFVLLEAPERPKLVSVEEGMLRNLIQIGGVK
ncbi:3-dehydroquinate synthase [Alteribacter keqinensis]|uniref:3-dehydroquinate synthase n=1 Tax=Alteribacter keqinensis TaxID=2483800 RepID=A0A3M7TU23_9BACI|nr:3-dehydroquinate synthase [Alteribacter keqinensis]RNA69146.1 3-dehydroquinate synthase [Alteribacter keqinensis]